jgi:GH25 family lysozyme M1 (1,4-beta-N-acetylmuramidase)
MTARILLFSLFVLSTTRSFASYLSGIDVSHYQGAIDWEKVASADITFVSIKATEGSSYTDPDFEYNWKASLRAGIVRTAYHFAHPSISASDQAVYFVDAVIAAGGYDNNATMQLMLDLEDADKQSPAVVWAWVQAFAAAVKARVGRPIIIYTGYYFWRDSVGDPHENLDAPLWIAAYIPTPLIPVAWPTWTFWQHADNGTIPGISGRVDVDYFNGSRQDLEKLCFL